MGGGDDTRTRFHGGSKEIKLFDPHTIEAHSEPATINRPKLIATVD